MALIQQKLASTSFVTVGQALKIKLRISRVLIPCKKGDRNALTGGSHGIASYREIMKTLVAELRAVGARPFVFPAMGRQRSATAEGQRKVLAVLGITERCLGCPVVSSLKTPRIGTTPEGLPVYVAKTGW